MSCIRNQHGYIICYTDGACINNGYQGAQAGIGVYFGDNHPWNVSEALHSDYRQTNNTAEIRAAIEAIKIALKKQEFQMVILSDSDFLIQGITNWINQWENNGWVNSNGTGVVNKQDFLDLKYYQGQMIDVIFQWEARNSSQGNREADRLAKNGASGSY